MNISLQASLSSLFLYSILLKQRGSAISLVASFVNFCENFRRDGLDERIANRRSIEDPSGALETIVDKDFEHSIVSRCTSWD